MNLLDRSRFTRATNKYSYKIKINKLVCDSIPVYYFKMNTIN